MPHVSYNVPSLCNNVRSTGYNDSDAIIMDRASGAADPTNIYLGGMEPMVTLQSTDIATLVALNGGTFVSTGLCVTGSSTTVPLALRADCGILASGSNHTTLVGNSVIITPTKFEVRQDTEEGATCDLEVRFRSSDGITAPITVSNSASLASTSLSTSFGLGKVYVGGVEVSYLTGITINPGIQLQMQRVGGGIYPLYHYITLREPSIDFTVEDARLAYTYIFRYGDGTTAVPIAAFFRARKHRSAYELDATEAHVKFSFADALTKMESLEASQTGNGSTTIRCYGKALVATPSVAIA